MSPVAFQLVGASDERRVLVARARALTEAGIRVFKIEPGRGLLVRSDRVVEAETVLASLEQDAPQPSTDSEM